VDILYRCKCTKEDHTVHVPDRVSGTELMHWMNIMSACVGYDHQSRSPLCYAFKMEYVKIPFDGEDGSELGVPPVKQ
jgi:hypothetical protein